MSEEDKMEAAKAALARKRGLRGAEAASQDGLRQAELASQDEASQDGAEATPGGDGESGRAKPPFYEANAAFVKAQSEFEPVAFDKENPHFKNKYASLGAVLKATLPALNRHGIALVAQTEVVGGEIIVATWLMYGGLVFARTEWPVGKQGTPPQQLGSALTYARRYTLQSLLGVAAEEDDDGNAATPAAKAEEEAPF